MTRVNQYYWYVLAQNDNETSMYYGMHLETSFGAMIGMTQLQISDFISTNRGKTYDYQVHRLMWTSADGKEPTTTPIKGMSRTSTKPQEGSYDYLRK
ncbi:MAG: hypothetical protein KG003_08160 [Bacteroidetes bacterium]|nr:hypothetical protein [Bacteroidota bacterium]